MFLKDLKMGRVYPFTKDTNFDKWMEETFERIKKQVKEDQMRYSQDWVSVGLPGLANGCIRKASRLFDLMVLDMIGKDKVEDEFLDNLMLAFYAYTYYKELERRIDDKTSN